MAATVLGIHLTGVHASRPTTGVSAGTLYSCTTHSLVYQTTDTGTTWVTWANLAGTGSTTTVATDTIWDAAGDVAVGTGSDTAAKVSLGAVGTVLGRSGATIGSVFPPGYELDYVQITANASITATSEATANTVITSSSVTFDGAAVLLNLFSPGFKAGNATGGDITVLLRDDTAGTVLGDIGYKVSQAANDNYVPLIGQRRLTPAAGARVYSIRAFVSTGTGVILAAAGGTGNTMLPAFLRITKV